MKIFRKTTVFIILSLVCLSISFAQVPTADSLALVKLYDSTGGDSWINHSNWKSATKVGDWFGVTVNGGRVKQIILLSNNLTGSLPAQIGDLTALEHLNLNGNQISGNIPAEIDALSNLSFLNLSYNNFSDNSFPGEMSNLTGLMYLFLDSNSLSAIPPFVFNLTALQTLSLGYNQITLIPANIQYLTELKTLNLPANQLNGNVPSQLAALTNLQALNLAQNGFDQLPATVTDITSLTSLYMWGNALDEAHITNLAKLVNLKQLSLSNNAFHEIPVEITNLTGLVGLYLGSNQITSSGLGLLRNMTQLTSLSLGNNQLDAFPAEVLSFTNLGSLDLSYNFIAGEIPSGIADLPNLVSLYLNANKFSGAVPPGITNLSNLIFIDVSNNMLDEFPALNTTNPFQKVKIENNYFTFEDIEPNLVFGNDVFTYAPQKEVGSGMDTTLARGSVLTLQVEVGGTSNEYEWFQDDVIIPNATGNTLNLSLNNPPDFGVYKLRITNTQATELELWSKPFVLRQKDMLGQDSLALVALYNALNGPDWTNRTGWLNGPLSTWYGVQIMDDRVFQLLLDNNNLSGQLPPEIGDLDGLDYLKLDHNKIHGVVPQEIGNMTALRDLHLQYNLISGIPDLNGLPNLQTLFIEGNKLVFEDIIPNIGAATATFMYAPQDSLDIGTQQIVRLGREIDLSLPTVESNNIYVWYNDGVQLSTGDNPFQIFPAAYDNSGTYTCRVTNASLPDLTLHLKPVDVKVVDEPILYYQTDAATAPKTAQVHLSINPGNLPTTLEIQYGKSTSYGQSTTYSGGQLIGTEFLGIVMLIPNLEPNTVYQYRIIAQNDSGSYIADGLSCTTKPFPVSYSFNEHIALPERNKNSDYQASDYRLFGLPGSGNIPVEDIFTGTADKDWIAYLDNGNVNNYYQKFGTVDDFYFNQGRAFWVLSLNNVDINRSVDSPQLNAFSEAEIGLHSGWNLITNPFDQSVDWANVMEVNDINGYQIYSFNGAFNTPDKLDPFQGYLFRPPTGVTTLKIPFPDGFLAKALDKKPLSREGGWELNLVLESEGFTDATTRLGVRGNASEEEIQNFKKPRVMGDILNIWFEHPEWDENEPAYVTDFRPAGEAEHTWKITTNLFPGKKAVLRVLNIDQIPVEQEAYLIRTSTNRFWNLRETDRVNFVPNTRSNVFELVVGEKELVEDVLEKIAPTKFAMEQNYPNPFNPSTMINYELPITNYVELAVYNSLGQKVRTLVNGQQEAGSHSAVFNSDGLASGIYYYRITAGTFSETRKMILLR